MATATTAGLTMRLRLRSRLRSVFACAAALRSGIGVMPYYRAALKEDQIAAIAKYVSTVTEAGK
jgi:mono/diheme cytochrome c family protein